VSMSLRDIGYFAKLVPEDHVWKLFFVTGDEEFAIW
jgi:hypothetical protein